MISKPAHAGASHNHHSNSSKCSIPGASSTHRRPLYLPPLFLLCPTLLFLPAPLQVALSVQGSGEGHVVEGPGDAVGPRVRCHSGDAVLRLVGGEFSPQLLSSDEVLTETELVVFYFTEAAPDDIHSYFFMVNI